MFAKVYHEKRATTMYV